MTTTQPPAVRAYLDELRAVLAGSPDRDLVVDGVARHIEDALGDGASDATRVQAVLDELGDPAVIAAEASPGAPASPLPAPFLERRGGMVLTVLLLTVGEFVVPVAGWLVGVGLLWGSTGWRLVDKLVGTFAVPVVLAAALGISTLASGGAVQQAGSVVPSHLLLLVLFPVLVIAVGVTLVLRFRPRG